MDVVMKRRVIGAAVLVGAGVLIPIMLVKLAKPSAPPSGESVRVYEITPAGEARPTGEEKPKQAVTSTAQEPAAPQPAPAPAQTEPETTPEPAPQTQPEAIAPSPEAAEVKPAPAPTPVPEPQPQAKSQPQPKPQAESASAAPPPATAQKPYFAVQIGSFGDKENAVALTQKLQRDFPVYYREGQLNGKQFYRVRVGPYDSREAAEVVATRLRERGVKTQTMSLP